MPQPPQQIACRRSTTVGLVCVMKYKTNLQGETCDQGQQAASKGLAFWPSRSLLLVSCSVPLLHIVVLAVCSPTGIAFMSKDSVGNLASLINGPLVNLEVSAYIPVSDVFVCKEYRSCVYPFAISAMSSTQEQGAGRRQCGLQC